MTHPTPSRRALVLGAALAATSARAGWFPRFQGTAAPPTSVLVPGASPSNYVNRADLQSYAGTYGLPGRPEYGTKAQVGTNDQAAADPTKAAVVSVIMDWVWPSATDTIAQNDFELKYTAFCRNENGLLGGVDRTEVWANGVMLPVSKPGLMNNPLTDAQGGGGRKLPGYTVPVNVSGLADGTRIEFYVKAYPTAAMMAKGLQPRTIGPLFVTKKASFDRTVAFDPDGVPQTNLDAPNPLFPTAKAALNALQTWAGWPAGTDKHVLVKYTGTRPDIDVTDFVPTTNNTSPATYSNGRTGRVYLDGNGVTVRNKSAVTSAVYASLRMYYSGLVVQNFKFDMKRVGSFFTYGGERIYPIFINCEVYSSDGMLEVNPYSFGPRDLVFTPGGARMCWHQVYVHDMDCGGGLTVPVKVGCKMERCSGDATNYQGTDPLTVIAFDCDKVDAAAGVRPNPRIALTYSGPEGQSAATYSVTGTPEAAGRTLTLYVNGSPVANGAFPATLTSPAPSGTYYLVSEVIQAINALPNWHAEAVNGSTTKQLRFAYLGPPPAFYNNTTDPKSTFPDDRYPASLGVITGQSQHNDYMQFVGLDNAENITFLGCYGVRGLNQLIYVSNAATNSIANIIVGLCAFHNSTDWSGLGNIYGQVYGKYYHLIIAACTQPDSPFGIGDKNSTYIDEFSLFENIYADGFTFGSTLTSSTFKAKLRNLVSMRRTVPADMPTSFPNIDRDSVQKIIPSGAGSTNAFGNNVFNTADFPALARGRAVGDGQTDCDFAPSDFTPAAGGYLRQAQYLGPPSFDTDIEGRPTNPLGDMVGAVALAAVPA